MVYPAALWAARRWFRDRNPELVKKLTGLLDEIKPGTLRNRDNQVCMAFDAREPAGKEIDILLSLPLRIGQGRGIRHDGD